MSSPRKPSEAPHKPRKLGETSRKPHKPRKTPLRPGKHKVSIRHAAGPDPIDLTACTRLIPLPSHGPEDVISDRCGGLLVGCEDGSIYRIDATTSRIDLLANTGGRPLGLELTDNHLIVCDSYKGLLRYELDWVTAESNQSGGPAFTLKQPAETLVTHVNGKPLKFCSNATVAPDGTVWFTESTSRFHYPEFMGAILEHRATGSVNRLNTDGTVEQVVPERYFANGIVAEPDGTGVLFCETTDYAVRRVDVLTGRVGGVEENLPGFPDNMSALDERGGAWSAYAHPRSWALDLIAKLPGVIRHIAWWMPDAIRPGPKHDVWLTRWEYDPTAEGAAKWRMGRQIRGHHPKFHTATAAVQLGDTLYAVSKDHGCVLEIDLTSVPAQ